MKIITHAVTLWLITLTKQILNSVAESASELYRLSDRSLSANLLQDFLRSSGSGTRSTQPRVYN
jgi:hypothetical protein